jgi:hypothetical protein
MTGTETTTTAAPDRPYDREAAAKDLREAARLIRRSRSVLNEETNPCRCCGVAIYEAPDELRAARAIGGVAENVDKWARRFEMPEGLASDEETQ